MQDRFLGRGKRRRVEWSVETDKPWTPDLKSSILGVYDLYYIGISAHNLEYDGGQMSIYLYPRYQSSVNESDRKAEIS